MARIKTDCEHVEKEVEHLEKVKFRRGKCLTAVNDGFLGDSRRYTKSTRCL